MKEREITKKNLIILQQIEFEGKMGLLKSAEEKMKEFLKTYTKPLRVINLNSSPAKREDDIYDTEKENLPKRDPHLIQKREVSSLSTLVDKTENMINGESRNKPIKQVGKDKKRIEREQVK